SYVVRRALCGLTAKNYNNVFLRIASQIQANGASCASFLGTFGEADGDAVRFPNDAELSRQILERRQYGNIQQSRLRHILCELEYAARDKFDESGSIPADLTIEHVLPDTWMEHWPLSDGTKVPADQRTGMAEPQLTLIADREAVKHTLGNLTLLTDARNPSLSNLCFGIKRKALSKSLLKLNREIADLSAWTEESIRARASRFAGLAIRIWPRAIDAKLI
ncbi:MAG: HNH endonuclease family protein, partial [Acidobacteriota bacterium]|nr:HNH endonuclease family protein [Acidobacteriota bacterium]